MSAKARETAAVARAGGRLAARVGVSSGRVHLGLGLGYCIDLALALGRVTGLLRLVGAGVVVAVGTIRARLRARARVRDRIRLRLKLLYRPTIIVKVSLLAGREG